jgi:hypothetical protein
VSERGEDDVFGKESPFIIAEHDMEHSFRWKFLELLFAI